jgi:hypothetical protein
MRKDDAVAGKDRTVHVHHVPNGHAVFGPSRILVLGPDSALGPLIAATILPLIAAGGDAERAVALASEFLAGNLAPPAPSRSAGHISFPSGLR